MAPSHRCKQRLPGSESKLEIADIFRAHAPAWRRANAGHVSLSQLKVMSSVEACRTEALGGHVAACGKCNHQHIAYNSCKNRHCDDLSLRDQHIAQIQTYGRLAWQVRSGYNQRSRAEAQIGRWKSVIGPKLRSRRFENQKTEAQIGVRALNRMTELGCARFESVG